jgi:tetratricopeptide (TPR) repeat protein
MVCLICATLTAAPIKSDLEKQGLEAIASHLPEVAATRFAARLAVEPLDADEALRLRLLLAESWVRADQADQALELLAHPTLTASAVAKFWQAQAHRSRGELQAAIDLLNEVIETKNFPHHGEAVLTRSRLLSAQGNHRDAIAGLNLLTTIKSPLSTRAQLDQTRLLIHTHKFEQARKALPLQKNLKGAELLEAQLLDAALMLKETQFTKAAAACAALVAKFSKEGEELPAIIHPAAINQARALASLNQRSEATDLLLAFIQNQPDSPSLDDAFDVMRTLLLASNAEDDPVSTTIRTRLEQWSSSPPFVHPAIFPLSTSGVADLPPTIVSFDHPELHAQALYLRVVSLNAANEIEEVEQQRRLITQMRMEHPEHPLTRTAIIDFSRTLFRNEQADKALSILENFIESAPGSTSEISAYLALAEQYYQKQEYALAGQAFEKAATNLLSTPRNNALFNAGISWLLAGDPLNFDKVLGEATPKLTASLRLEQSLYAASRQPLSALSMLENFILEYPQHPRINEARLAMAFCALQQIPPARSTARALLESIDACDSLAETLALAKIQLAATGDDPAETITLCRTFLSTYKDSPNVAEVTLTYGTALYQNGDLNDARQTLQLLEVTHPDQAAPALLVAARAAARTGTPQSLIDALALFDKVIHGKSPLAPFAALEKSRCLIETKSPTSLLLAVEEINTLLAILPAASPLHKTSSLMLLEPLYALGGTDATHYQRALDLQKKLLENETLAIEDRHRVQYYRGLTLEQMQRLDQALDVYYQVLESAATQPPANWDYLERCGFNAIALLEKNRRWEPAIALAKKMAALPSPRAPEAAARADRLSLEYMILDE